jgi:hypothetical protein
MRSTLYLLTLLLVAGCHREKVPATTLQQLGASDAIKVLRADSSPYRIIYTPPVDLTKKPAPVTSGPVSPRRG